VNRPGDQYDREADRVADHVMRMTEMFTMQRHLQSPEAVNILQRKCSEREENEETQIQVARKGPVQKSFNSSKAMLPTTGILVWRSSV
jgi:hypothetical protein